MIKTYCGVTVPSLLLLGVSRFEKRATRIFSFDEKSFLVSSDMVHLRTIIALVFIVIEFVLCNGFCGVIAIESTRTFNVYSKECVAVVK